jgi:hypothetical protein
MNIRNSNAYLTGMGGVYKHSNVRGTSEITDTDGFNRDFNGVMDNDTYKRANQGGINGKVFLDKYNYENPKNNLHNNIGSSVLLEQIMTNKILIDSSFQDHKNNPDPFRFIVKFNGIQPYYEDICVKFRLGSDSSCSSSLSCLYCSSSSSGSSCSYSSYNNEYEFSYLKYGSDNVKINGDNCVVIDKAFKNVKCVYIDELIMPVSITYKTTDDGSYKKCHNLAHNKYKYLILKINELSNNRFFTSNKKMGNEAFIMKADKNICHNNHLWIPIYGSVCYPLSNLKNIDRLTIEICDDQNKRLVPQLDGVNHDFYADYVDTINYAKQKLDNDEEIEIEIINKLNSLKEIIQGIYPEIHLTIDTVEAQINTIPGFRQ